MPTQNLTGSTPDGALAPETLATFQRIRIYARDNRRSAWNKKQKKLKAQAARCDRGCPND